MRAAAQGFTSRQHVGVSIGIIPGGPACDGVPCEADYDGGLAPIYKPSSYPNEFVELPIYTHLPLSGTCSKPRTCVYTHGCAVVMALSVVSY
jgi:hypothetical protein